MSLLQTERNLAYLYQILARCPKTSDEASKQRMTDTLVYQHGSLRVWYYTDPDSGEVLRRDRREWSADRILEVFSASLGGKPAPHGVPIAFYIHFAAARAIGAGASSQRHKGEQLTGTDRVIDLATKYCHQYGEEAEPLSVDYFDADTLRAFLGTRDNKHNVVLQKFVRGNSDHASMVQVVWSPHRIVTMQRQNKHPLTDLRVPLYQRSNTFDNTTHLSHEVRPTAVMSSRLDVECRKIVAHIHAVEQRVVTRLVVFFAFDLQRLPVLLFASEIQLTTQSATTESVRMALSQLSKRKLCMVSPQLIPSDVKLPHRASLASGSAGSASPGGGGGGGRGSALNLEDAASDSTAIRSALQRASGELSFDDEMTVLDDAFDSAYEARRDRGMLTEEQRHVLVGKSVFRAGIVGADAWQQVEQSRQHKEQHSYLQVRRRFYVADPLNALPSRCRSASVGADSVESQSHASPQTTLPGFSASPVPGSIRPSSSCSTLSRGVVRAGAHYCRSGSSSLLLHSHIVFSRGGGGGLFLKRNTAADEVSTLRDGTDNGDVSSNGSGYFDGTYTLRESGFRSPANQSPMKGVASKASSPVEPGPYRLPNSLQFGNSSANYDSIDAGQVGAGGDARVTWTRWMAALESCADYRAMIRQTFRATVAGGEGALAQSAGIPAAANAMSDVQQARVDALRQTPEGWVDAELPDTTTCPPEALVCMWAPQNRRGGGGAAVGSSGALRGGRHNPRRLNLWPMLRRTLSLEWAVASAVLHRNAVDALEEVLLNYEGAYHANSVATGGAPFFDVSLSLRLGCHGDADAAAVVDNHAATAVATRGGGGVALPTAAHDDSPSKGPVVPWEVAPLLLWALIHPSECVPIASGRDQACGEDPNANAGDAIESSIRTFIASQASSFQRIPVYSKRVLRGMLGAVLSNSVSNSKSSAASGGTTATLMRDPADLGTTMVQLKFHQVTPERLQKTHAAVRSLITSVSASWNFNAVACLHAIRELTSKAVVDKPNASRGNKGKQQGHANAQHNNSAKRTVVIVPPQLFEYYSDEETATASGGASSASSHQRLLMSEETWAVVVSTVSTAARQLEKRVESSSFEWPPRLVLLPC